MSDEILAISKDTADDNEAEDGDGAIDEETAALYEKAMGKEENAFSTRGERFVRYRDTIW